MSEWKPIETASKDGTRIIVCSENGNVWCDVKWEKMQRVPDRWSCVLGALPFKPIVWQPLPEPPK